jgi:RNA polymerase sigma factor (TIGR02999 family)
LFERLRGGDQSALNELMTALYDELRRIAARHLQAERSNHTLQTTALVHEVYLKLFDREEQRYTDKVHFLSVASRVMRQVLVDYARARSTKKRGGNAADVGAWASIEVDGQSGLEVEDLIELDDALNDLAGDDKSLADLIEMRYFGGMTAEETAQALDISVHVVRHDLRLAQAWLRRRMQK